MKTVFLNVFDMSVTASFVILAILLIRLLLRKAPRKYSYALWGAAAFRLSCPFSFEAAFSLFNLSFSLSKTVGVSIREVPGHSSAETLLPKVSVPAVQMPVSGAAIVPTPAEVTADPMQTLVQIASILWLIGIAALLGYAVFSWIRLKRQLWNAVRLEDNIWQSETVRSPFIFGLFHPRIYIPYGMDETVREYVLAHERYHLKRLDHIVKPLAFLLLSVHWFNPLVWLAFCLMGRDMEMSCDEKVLGSRENIRKAYSTTLLSFAAGRPFPLPSPLAFGETAVKSRIKNVLNWKKPTLWITIAAAVIAVIVIAVCIADPASTISGMESVSYNDKAVSEEAGMELVQMVNSSGKTIHAKNYARSADDDSIVTIRCGDGSFYELHYWYYSGFSFNPLHPGEDDYCSILTRYDASGKAKRAWKMAYDFDENFVQWMEQNLPSAENTEVSEKITGSYVSWQCLYMSPLSSFAAIGGDSGCRYLITADAFTIQDRNGSKQVFRTDWNWQEFPYSQEEWDEFQAPLGDVDLEFYSDRSYIPLSSGYDLFRMNGELWLVKYSSHPDGRRYIWSIYSLIPESAMGFAEWEFRPAVSSVYPAFPFTFDMDYDEVTVFCSEGNLIDYDAIGNKAITDTFLTFPAGNRVYWCPMDDDGVSTGAALSFTMQRGDITVAAGTVYITGSGNLYTARLVGTGLVMTRSEEYGAVISLMEDSYIRRTERVPDGDPATSGGTIPLDDDTPLSIAAHRVTFSGKDRFSNSGDNITYENPGAGADAFSSNMVIRHTVEPIEPFQMELLLPAGWTIRQPAENEATYAAMTFQPMNIFDETGAFAGTVGFNTFTAEQAEIRSGDEPDGEWGPENYTGIYWTIMTGYLSWNNDYTTVKNTPDVISATCRIRYDSRMPAMNETVYNTGILACSKELMCWAGIELTEGAATDQELLAMAASISFSPVPDEPDILPAPDRSVPSGYQAAVMSYSHDEQPEKNFNIELVLPEGWVLSSPGDIRYSSPIDPVFSIIDQNGGYVGTVFRSSYTPVPEAAGEWNGFRAVYSDIMLGSGYSWGTGYMPVTRTDTGETAVDQVHYADWFIDEDEPVTRPGILSYDSRYEEFIAVEFITDADEDVIRTIAESIRFAER